MKNIFVTALCFFFMTSYSQQIPGAMTSSFEKNVVEEGKRNIILQNKCGNRLTLLMFDDRTNLEFTYKPNALRRKDFRARNFSGRDNFTLLFPQVTLPMIHAGFVTDFGYDPFVTVLKTKNQWDGKNEITVVNIADENVFAVSAKSPLLIEIKAHRAFQVSNGMLMEKFTDRGEEIVSYIAFENMEQNRFRVLSDGTYVLQIFENEVVYFGGEENEYQVNRAMARLKGKSLKELIAMNEQQLAPKMNQGVIRFNDPDFQKVLDINHRIVYSGIDEGGACFGALNRIYYLIWVRDGSMTSSLMARAGNTELIKTWAPFLLNNPSITTREDGTKVPEYLQIVGSRWTRNEDDGIYYAVMSLYTYFKTTGQSDLLQGGELPLLVQAIDRYLEKNWKENRKMIISNTIGETPLKDDPYFGYDVVNGNYERNSFHISQGKELKLNASLYLQTNTYNIMLMAAELLAQRPDVDKGHSVKYLQIASDLKKTISTEFYDKQNDCLYSGIEFYTDNTEGPLSMKVDANPWEGSWACAIGPFFPVPDLQLKTARVIYDTWPKITKQGYGYCPWNTISNVLYEYGMPSGQYRQMLAAEIKDAVTLTQKYPMPGGLTEYNTAPEGWRALPFSAGSLFFSMSAQMLRSLPSGIAVRASSNVDSILNFRYRLSSITGSAAGKGDKVGEYILNGEKISATLQIPENKLVPGKNYLQITRVEKNDAFRLYSSSAQLSDVSEVQNRITYTFNSILPVQIYFENADKAKTLEILNAKNEKIPYTKAGMNNTNITVLELDPKGTFRLIAEQ